MSQIENALIFARLQAAAIANSQQHPKPESLCSGDDGGKVNEDKNVEAEDNTISSDNKVSTFK